MKITKQRLKEIIREELMTERVATVPQVQQMATTAGVRLSYGDAKALAAKTPAERGALLKLKNALKDGSWRRMTEELAMERLSGTDKENLVSRVEKLLMHSLIDEEGVATLIRVVHELEGLYPVPRESETEDWTKPRGASHFRR